MRNEHLSGEFRFSFSAAVGCVLSSFSLLLTMIQECNISKLFQGTESAHLCSFGVLVFFFFFHLAMSDINTVEYVVSCS